MWGAVDLLESPIQCPTPMERGNLLRGKKGRDAMCSFVPHLFHRGRMQNNPHISINIPKGTFESVVKTRYRPPSGDENRIAARCHLRPFVTQKFLLRNSLSSFWNQRLGLRASRGIQRNQQRPKCKRNQEDTPGNRKEPRVDNAQGATTSQPLHNARPQKIFHTPPGARPPTSVHSL